MTFGIPKGSCRIAAVPISVPAEPPRLKIPAIACSEASCATSLATPCAATATACPRSPRSLIAAREVPAIRKTVSRSTSKREGRRARRTRIDHQGLEPLVPQHVAHERHFVPFGIKGPHEENELGSHE